MQVIIHRGTHQIGGCITEIRSRQARIIIDMGEDLPSIKQSVDSIDIDGVTSGEANCDGVFITHYHGDHIGLCSKILPDVPVYMGKVAHKIFLAFQKRCKSKHIAAIERFNTFTPAQKITLKDMVITPLRVDHSAFDAYMFLVESNGKKILHTGDFRMHGQTGGKLLPTLEKWAGKVDVLITEGTTLSRNDDETITEQRLQLEAARLLKAHKYVFVMCSSTNIDRIGAFYQATPRGKYFLCDDYQKSVLDIVSDHNKTLKKSSPLYQFEKALTYGDNLLEMMQKQGFCMLVRAGNQMFQKVMANFPDSLFIYSMWNGYLDGNAKIENICDFVPPDYVYLHTSGHATSEAIKKVCDTVQPKTIIPIHGENPKNIEKLNLPYDVKYLNDGELYEIE